MIDTPLDPEDRERTKAALTAATAGDHLDAGRLRRIQDRLVCTDHDLAAEAGDPDLEALRGQVAASAEGLEAQQGHRPPLSRQASRTAVSMPIGPQT